MKLKLFKSKRLGARAKGGKKSVMEQVESIRTGWNKFRSIVGVDTSKSRW